MALIEFTDYPNTDTPISSENLNHNFNELNEKNYILLRMSANYTIEESNTEYTIPFDTTKVKQGDKLTHKDNTIVIGTEVSRIKCSLEITTIPSTTGGQAAYIFKNGKNDRFIGGNGTAGLFCNFGCNDWIMDVTEGDVVDFRVYGKESDIIDLSRSHIYIEVIE